jgi:hypothetical protein
MHNLNVIDETALAQHHRTGLIRYFALRDDLAQVGYAVLKLLKRGNGSILEDCSICRPVNSLSC